MEVARHFFGNATMQWMNKRKNTRGAALVEYVVLMAIVGGLAIFSVVELGGEIGDVYGDLDTVVADETDSVLDPGGPGGGGPGGGGPTPPVGAVVAEINAVYEVMCTATYVTDIGVFANNAIEDYFSNGGQVGLGAPWMVNWNLFYEEGGDPGVGVQEFYDRSIDWSTVPNWVITSVDATDTGYDMQFGPDNSTVVYNEYVNGNYGWTRPGLSSCFEGYSNPLTYNLEATHPSGTILRLAMQMNGTN